MSQNASSIALRYFDAWNRRDAAGMAALFSHDGSLVGFDGSQIDGGPQAVAAHLGPIFASRLQASGFGLRGSGTEPLEVAGRKRQLWR